MSTQTTNAEKDDESSDERRAEAVAKRLERLTSMGAPTCDVCYSLEPENRPAEADFWPDPMTIYVNDNANVLADWMGTTVCDHHVHANQLEVSHRVRARTEYIGKEHRMNSAHRYEVLSVKEVDC